MGKILTFLSRRCWRNIASLLFLVAAWWASSVGMGTFSRVLSWMCTPLEVPWKLYSFSLAWWWLFWHPLHNETGFQNCTVPQFPLQTYALCMACIHLNSGGLSPACIVTIYQLWIGPTSKTLWYQWNDPWPWVALSKFILTCPLLALGSHVDFPYSLQSLSYQIYKFFMLNSPLGFPSLLYPAWYMWLCHLLGYWSKLTVMVRFQLLGGVWR